MDEIVKEIIITKKCFDEDKIKIGTRMYIKRVLSCEVYPNGWIKNKTYDLETEGIVSDIYIDDGNKIESFAVELLLSCDEYIDIDINEYVNGEWEIEILK